MNSLSFLSVSPIYLGKAEGNGGNVIHMVIVFKTFSIPFYKWVFKSEGEKWIFPLDGDNVVHYTVTGVWQLPLCCNAELTGLQQCF